MNVTMTGKLLIDNVNIEVQRKIVIKSVRFCKNISITFLLRTLSYIKAFKLF